MSFDRTCKSSSWTKEENEAFENALAVYSGDGDQILQVAAAVPGKSPNEVIEHYLVLVEDIKDIESGIVPLPKYRRMQSSTERRKGIPWTAEEHRLFLQGLAKYGKGDWRAISRKFVLSRTPTQVASHAQKFYTRLNDNNNPKKRRSIHDVTSAADITEPSQGQISDKLKGPCGGQLQWSITDTGMLSIPGPVTNCMTDAIEGPSAVDPETFPLGAAVGSELNSSYPGMVEFLQSIEGQIAVTEEGTSGVCHGVDTRTAPSHSLQPSVAGDTGRYTHPVTVLAEGTSGVRHGVYTRTSPSLSLQPSVAGGSGMYIPPVNNVRYDLEELMSKQLFGSSQVGNTASLPLPIADHIGVHGCAASSSGSKDGFASTMGAPDGGFPIDSLQLPSIPGSSGSETYPCWNPSSMDDRILDLEDLFPDHIFGLGK